MIPITQRFPAAPARMPVPVAVSMVAVLLLHAAVLLGRQGAEGTSRAPTAMQVRMVQSAPRPMPQHPAIPSQPAPEPPAAEPPSAPQPTGLSAVLASALGLSSLTDLPFLDQAPAAAAVADGDYRPRAELTTSPQPKAPIQVLYPPSFVGAGDFSAQLSLFIDEEGVVRRVRVDTVGLPAVLEEAASQAFLSARFEPGSVDGQPVKSLMRVEVAFENGPV